MTKTIGWKAYYRDMPYGCWMPVIEGKEAKQQRFVTEDYLLACKQWQLPAFDRFRVVKSTTEDPLKLANEIVPRQVLYAIEARCSELEERYNKQ